MKMIYKKVGKIKEELSAIGLGTWNFSGNWDGFDESNCIDVVHKAIDLGVNLFDVAPVYGLGQSEEVLGKALLGGKREKIVIATKCGLVWDANNNVSNNLTKASVITEVEDSLRRLQTDYLDVLQLHWPDPKTSLEETAEALNQLKKDGKIRYVGLSNYSPQNIVKMMEYVQVDTLQALYNMLERNPKSYHGIELTYKTEEELFPLCKEHGMAFLPYSPLFQGLLTDKAVDGLGYSKDDVRSSNPKMSGDALAVYMEPVKQLKGIADSIGKPLSQLALNWLVQQESVTSIIGGASNVAQMESNAAAASWEMTEDVKQAVDAVLEPFKAM